MFDQVVLLKGEFRCWSLWGLMGFNNSWVFFLQIDTYGILGTIHCLLFLDYMKVYKDDKGRWKVNKSFKRYELISLFLFYHVTKLMCLSSITFSTTFTCVHFTWTSANLLELTNQAPADKCINWSTFYRLDSDLSTR